MIMDISLTITNEDNCLENIYYRVAECYKIGLVSGKNGYIIMNLTIQNEITRIFLFASKEFTT